MGSALVLFAVATLPVAAGMLLRRVRPAAARAIEGRVGVLGLVAIPVLVAAVVWTEKERVLQALATAGGLALLLNALSVSLVWGIAALAGLDRRQRIPVALECSLQNFAVAAFVALTLLADASLLLAPLAYGLTCFLPAIVIVVLGRRLIEGGAGSASRQPA
jgi:BASS family bile acid:Na+ symporter